MAARDHPRICGEHLVAASVLSMGVGSSPHMRGARVGLYAQAQAQGIIPAYAGSTLSCYLLPQPHWDHPRICGEHRARPSEVILSMGSSPHMRGAP